jgi:hypothetical protein
MLLHLLTVFISSFGLYLSITQEVGACLVLFRCTFTQAALRKHKKALSLRKYPTINSVSCQNPGLLPLTTITALQLQDQNLTKTCRLQLRGNVGKECGCLCPIKPRRQNQLV